MVRSPSVDKNGIKKGAWSEEEDNILRAYVERHGHWNWRQLPKFAGLARCGKSCRLRWLNYLKPGLKKGVYSKEEEELIVKLREELGNKWSVIALQLPGRTDNEIKNHWHTHLRKRTKQDVQPSKSTSTQEKSGMSHGMPILEQKKKSKSTNQWPQNREFDASDVSSSFLESSASFWSELFLLDTSNTMVSPSGSCNSTLLNTLASSKSFVESSGSFLNEPLTLNDYKILENTIPTATNEDFRTDPFLIEASNNQVFPEDYEELHQILSSSSEDEGFYPFSPSADDDGYDLMDLFLHGDGQM